MGDVFQIIGSILLLLCGVAVIVYVLLRKSPVKTETPSDGAAEDAADASLEDGSDEDSSDEIVPETEEDGDDGIPDGEAPKEIGKEA